MKLAKDHLEEKYLYKFRHIAKDSSDQSKHDENKLHYIERIFTHNELHFPSAVAFNDPVECRPLITVGDLSNKEYKEKYIEFSRKMMIEGGNTGDPNDITAWLENHSQEDAEDLCKEHTEQYRSAIIERYRICSFCATNNNPLVWSHYADSHQGFCLIFDADNELFGNSFMVEYQDEYPKLKFTEEDENEVLKNSVLVKFTDWSYEREYRLISAEPNFENALPVNNNKWVFPRELLKGVIFGYKISDSDRQLIENMCKDRPGDFQYKKAILHDDKYVLKIIDA